MLNVSLSEDRVKEDNDVLHKNSSVKSILK